MESDLHWWVVVDTGAEMLLSPETVILLCVILELGANMEIGVLTAEVSCMAADEGKHCSLEPFIPSAEAKLAEIWLAVRLLGA